MGTPRNIAVERSSQRLRITYRWCSWWSLREYLLMFLPLFGGLAILGAWSGGRGGVCLLSSMLPLVALVLYMILVLAVNRSVIEVFRNGRVTIRNGPLPLNPWANHDLDAADVRQVVSGKKVLEAGGFDGPVVRVPVYRVELLAHPLRRINVLAGRDMDTMEQARFVERQIEQFLQIPDRPEMNERLFPDR